MMGEGKSLRRVCSSWLQARVTNCWACELCPEKPRLLSLGTSLGDVWWGEEKVCPLALISQ